MSDFDPGIDIVVVNYRTPSDLERFLVSYEYVKDTVPNSLFVMDVDPVTEHKPANGQYVVFDENVGYARACNRGASLGNREIVALFNADTELFDNTLEKCYEAMISNPDWGVLGPMQVSRDGRVTHAGVGGTATKPVPRGWRSRSLDRYRDVFESVTVFGSAYFVNRTAWDQLSNCPLYRDKYPDAEGAFLPTPHYYEETWCSYHAREHGWKVMYFGEAIMIHQWHQASKLHGPTEKVLMPQSQKQFREMCSFHNIECD